MELFPDRQCNDVHDADNTTRGHFFYFLPQENSFLPWYTCHFGSSDADNTILSQKNNCVQKSIAISKIWQKSWQKMGWNNWMKFFPGIKSCWFFCYRYVLFCIHCCVFVFPDLFLDKQTKSQLNNLFLHNMFTCCI